MKLRELYRRAANLELVHPPDDAAYARAYRAHLRNVEEPGDCKGRPKLLAALAIAEADRGRHPGWIPEVQAIAAKIDAAIDAIEWQGGGHA